MTSEIIDIFDVQIEAPEQFDVLVEQTEVNLEPLAITENGTYYPQGSATGFSKVDANVLPKSTDIVFTENGEYHPNDYEVDAFSKVGVDVKPKLEDLTATDNGIYTPSEGFDGFGKVNVDLRGKVKVNSFVVSNKCINSEGRWEGNELIDVSDCTSLANAFKGCSLLKEIDVSTWNTENVTNANSLFYQCKSLSSGEKLDLKNLFAKHKCTSFVSMFEYCHFTTLDISNWDMSNISSLGGFLSGCQNLKEMDFSIFTFRDVVDSYAIFRSCIGLEKVNLIGTPLKNNTSGRMFESNSYPKLYTLVGDKTIDEVVSNNLGVYIGATTDQLAPPAILERNSLRAIINGVADLSGKEPHILIFGDAYIAKLTEEDIAIATAKNWTIA